MIKSGEKKERMTGNLNPSCRNSFPKKVRYIFIGRVYKQSEYGNN